MTYIVVQKENALNTIKKKMKINIVHGDGERVIRLGCPGFRSRPHKLHTKTHKTEIALLNGPGWNEEHGRREPLVEYYLTAQAAQASAKRFRSSLY